MLYIGQRKAHFVAGCRFCSVGNYYKGISKQEGVVGEVFMYVFACMLCTYMCSDVCGGQMVSFIRGHLLVF